MTYEIVKTLFAQDTPREKREAHLVKTEPVVCRKRGTFELYEVEHVIVEALSVLDEGVVYEETHVVASDETGKAFDAILYQAPRALMVDEAMFAIGSVKPVYVQGPVEAPEAPKSADNDVEDADGH